MIPFASAQKASGAGAAKSAGRHLPPRAPRLREFADRVVASLVKALQTMAGANTTVEGMLTGIATEKARDVIADHRPEAVRGIISSKDAGCTILATLDGTLVHAIVELLCGGNGVEPPSAELRPATPIDQQFALIPFSLTASAIQTEWAELGFGAARAAKIEGPLATDIFGARVDEVGIVNITIGVFGLHGTLRLVLPPVALERFAGAATDRPAEPDAPDPHWSSLLQQGIGQAPVALAAYLDAKDITLGSLTGLTVGQILPLPVDARSRASLVSEGRVLYRGELGQDEGRYSLRVEEIVCEPTNVALMTARRAPYFEGSRV